MIITRLISIGLLGVVGFQTLFLNPAIAGGSRSEANKAISPEEESRIQSLASLSTQEVFEELKKPAFLAKRDLTDKALQVALGHRRVEAIDIAKKCLEEPLMEVIGGLRIDRVKDFNLAKRVFEAFPDEAAVRLLSLYKKSDGITRGNIIRTAGGIDGGEHFESMLLAALDDKSAAEEESPEQLGDPLRICDLAYNQIVFKHNIRNVLRTISPKHTIATRDLLIGILKSRLAAGRY